jgi:hypothetical protein
MVLIGVLVTGFILIIFFEKNSKEPESKRKWSDPTNRDN